MMRARRRVADTTCLSTLAGFLLLAVVLGVYSRRIVRIELIPEALWRSGSAGPRT